MITHRRDARRGFRRDDGRLPCPLIDDDAVQMGDTVTHRRSAGVLLSDSWSLIDGSNPAAAASVTGSDTFNADGSATGSFSDVRDGTAGTVTVTSAGDITVVNTNAGGVVTSEDTYNAGTGNYTIATLNANGTTLNSYQYLPDGNVQVTDMVLLPGMVVLPPKSAGTQSISP